MLPENGGVLDQDARFVRAINVIRDEAEVLKEYHDGKESRGRHSTKSQPSRWNLQKAN